MNTGRRIPATLACFDASTQWNSSIDDVAKFKRLCHNVE